MAEASADTSWHAIWNFANPAGTQSRFESMIESGTATGPTVLILRTQVARCLGLQRKFREALALLDEVDGVLGSEPTEPRVYSLLERGRVLNSSGNPGAAQPLFQSAVDLAASANLWLTAVDAVHMLAIVAPTAEEQITHNLHGLELVQQHPEADRWTLALNNNLGEIYRSRGEYEKALRCFTAILEWQGRTGRPLDRYAQVDVAKMLRLTGKVPEGLFAIQSLAAEAADDGFVQEELAEALLAAGRDGEAHPLFVRAWEKLQHESWLKDYEPARYRRLGDLATRK